MGWKSIEYDGYGDVTGIYFFLSRKDAVVFKNPYSKKEDD